MRQESRRAQEHEKSLLRAEARHADQPRCGRDERWIRRQELRVDAAAHDVDLLFVARRSVQQELTPAVLADGDRERGLGDLARERDHGLGAEIRGPVRREAERRSAQLATQECHIRGVRGEVRMHMICARAGDQRKRTQASAR